MTGFLRPYFTEIALAGHLRICRPDRPIEFGNETMSIELIKVRP
jgi:hypothetical protein